jgi:septal ring factor EnvC (AmiA/AmiB activator)
VDEVHITDGSDSDLSDRGLVSLPIDRVIEHAIRSAREIADAKINTVNQRLTDMDKATTLLSETVNRVPTDLQTAIREVLRLMDERDRRIQDHFDAIKRLRETEGALNQKALEAALISQKEATAVSSASLDRAISANATLAAQQVTALAARVTQIADQVIRNQEEVAKIQAGRAAVAEQKVDTRGGWNSIYGGVGTIIALVSLIISAVVVVIGTR